MVKRALCSLLLTLLLTAMSGCSDGAPTKNDTNTGMSPNLPFATRSALSFVIDHLDVEKIYGKATVMRKTPDRIYEVYNMPDGSKLYAVYDKSFILLDLWQMKKVFERADFSAIIEGTSTIENVAEIDPYCPLANNHGVVENPISEHRLANGEVLIITYVKSNNKLIVNKMDFLKDDPSLFFKTIESEDLTDMSTPDSKGNAEKMAAPNMPFSLRSNISLLVRPSVVELAYGKAETVKKKGEYTYEVRSMNDSSKQYAVYNSQTNGLVDLWRLKKLFTKDDFVNIIVDTSTFEDVIAIDPYCSSAGVEWIKTLNEGEQFITEHRLADDKALIVHYKYTNMKGLVESLEYLNPDPSEFSKIIEPVDLPR